MICPQIYSKADTSLISNYNLYRKAIKFGNGKAVDLYRDYFWQKLIDKKYIQCLKQCDILPTCQQGCEEITAICTPTIEEYNEVVQCFITSCVSIEEVE